MISLVTDTFIIALQAVFANKMRALLTTLGIFIGILAVTLMGTLISGLDRSFEKSMDFLGKDVLFISRFEWFGNQEWWEVRNRRKLKLEYVDKLKEQVPYIKAIAPSMERHGSELSRGENSIDSRFMGTTPEYAQINSMSIEKGRFFSKGEDRSGTRVTVIGADVAEALFPNETPIGKKMKIQGNTFRVIGTIKKQGKFLGLWSMDTEAIIPLGAYTRLYARRGFLQLRIKVDENHIAEAKDGIIGTLRRLRGLRPHERDDFAINQQEAFRDQYSKIKLAIGGTGMFITVLSLLVGGIGIMNIMFVSVKERTREIGIRKAIGATPNMIMSQFLLESIFICMMGGLIGLGLAYGGSMMIDKLVFPSEMPLWLAGVSFLISVTVGLISGFVPSFRAAQLDPIESLRYE